MAIEAGAKEVVGIEPKETSFHSAKKEVKKAKFVIGSGLKIPFKNNSFDIVVMFEVLEHLPRGSENQCLAEIFRVLKPKGKIILSTQYQNIISCFLDPAWYFGHRHYSKKNIGKLLKENDFVINKIVLNGRFAEIFMTLSHYFFKWILKREDPFVNFWKKKLSKELKDEKGFASMYISATKK
jgi:ubiquinone/menaquinone biosynthesis C-methylase UbiE